MHGGRRPRTDRVQEVEDGNNFLQASLTKQARIPFSQKGFLLSTHFCIRKTLRRRSPLLPSSKKASALCVRTAVSNGLA